MEMPNLHQVALLILGLITSLSEAGCATSQNSKIAKPTPTDVDTIPNIMRASYETISGPAGVPRQWDRDRTLYAPGAIFVSVWQEAGHVKSKIMTPEKYRSGFKIGDGLFETEVGRRTERFGHVAQVRSISVVRSTPGGPITERYVNYAQLYWDDARWWISAEVWEQESPDLPVPEAWIGQWEEVTR